MLLPAPRKHIFSFWFSFFFITIVTAQTDLNEATSFYGHWEGKVSFKAFSVTQQMDLEIKQCDQQGCLKVIIIHNKDQQVKKDTLNCTFENGMLKIVFSAKSLSAESFCGGFLNLGLLDEKTMNGSFETAEKGCSAVDFLAVKKLPRIKNQEPDREEMYQSANADTNMEVGVYGDYKTMIQLEDSVIKDCGNGKVIRRADVLEIKLDNGKTLSLKNNDYSKGREHSSIYFFDGCVKGMNFYTVLSIPDEVGFFLLISKQDGTIYPMEAGDFQASPNGKKLLVYSMQDPEGGSNHVSIWVNKSGKLVREFLLNPNNWSPVGAKWINDNSIVLEATRFNEMTDEATKLKPKTLSFAANKWSLK